ncbi:ABC transporter substrate-binding protein [Anaerosphaera multitolerans]|uniref:ABC transporter substrate-binding protein n=1 Tax=Anaerosphaera multitolerans TaxID=2487351 RepID=A0A437S603_9FIRM|nr:ABC transporter substrate-binding protein [Anaerosphaera multitolerans]RVU54408.1 ABC transporter substrate-binding protein [Anaerosphaera multitolerans]
MKKNKLKHISLLLGMIILLTACGVTNKSDEGEGQGDVGKVVKFASQFPDMDSLDVHKYTTTDVILPAQNICEPLLEYDSNRELQPLLLETLPTTEDGVTYSCKLKEGVKFHDGTELTSYDVEYTFNRIFDPATQNLNTWLCDMILGGPEMLEGKAESLAGFKVIDDYNFEIELSTPYAPFLSVLSCEQMMIYPKEACEAAGDKWGIDTFVGTGPYELVEFVGKDYTRCKKNENYHGTPVEIDELYVYNMDPNTSIMEYEAGNLDLVKVETKMVEPYKTNEFKDQLVKVDLMAIIALNLNVNMEPLNDVKVRQALTYTIDKESLVQDFLQGNGTPANSIIPPNIMGHPDREANKYDPEKAKELLAAAGYAEGIKLESYVVEGDEAADIAVVLQEQMKASNIDLKINLVDQATYVDMRKAGEVQCPILTWYKDIPDPDNFTYTFYNSAGSQLFSSNWNDPETDNLMKLGRSLPEDEREAVYVELEKLLVEDKAAMVPLYNPVFYYLQSPKVTGVEYSDSMVRFAKTEKAE